MDSPLLGLTLGMAVALVAYAAVLPLRPRIEGTLVGSREALAFKLAAGIMVGLFVVAAGVMLVAIPPGLALGGRRRRVPEALPEAPTREGIERGEPTVVL